MPSPEPGAGMRRREFITLLGGVAAGWPLVVRAQQEAADHRVLGASTPAAGGSLVAAFERRLRELGWIEGRTIAITYSWGRRTQRTL